MVDGGQPTTVTVAPEGDYFVEGAKPRFLLADTVWSSFSDPTPDEWTEYLSVRASQGFDAILVSVLPLLHDWSDGRNRRMPFAIDGGEVRWRSLDESYFVRAAEMVAEARARGLTSILVAFWANYAPRTWLSVDAPGAVADPGACEALLDLMAEHFGPQSPLWLVSGDTDFTNAETISFYEQALHGIKARLPAALAGFHMQDVVTLPDGLASDQNLDFHAYQSGHRLELQALSYTRAEEYTRPDKRRLPVLNAEPCYEGFNYGFRRDGRFCASDVRRSFWQSFLAGATAGFCYGAHGMWGWHQPEATYRCTPFGFEPFPWRVALGFPGPSDLRFGVELIASQGLLGGRSAQDLLEAPDPGFRAAVCADGTLAVYLPHPATILLRAGLPDEATLWNLQARRLEQPRLTERGAKLRLEMPRFNGDALLVLRAR